MLHEPYYNEHYQSLLRLQKQREDERKEKEEETNLQHAPLKRLIKAYI